MKKCMFVLAICIQILSFYGSEFHDIEQRCKDQSASTAKRYVELLGGENVTALLNIICSLESQDFSELDKYIISYGSDGSLPEFMRMHIVHDVDKDTPWAIGDCKMVEQEDGRIYFDVRLVPSKYNNQRNDGLIPHTISYNVCFFKNNFKGKIIYTYYYSVIFNDKTVKIPVESKETKPKGD